MKPAPFEYHAPERADEVVGLLAELGDDAKVLAGGQSLVPMLNLRLAVFRHLVDIRKVDELRGIERRNGHLWVGAGTTEAAVEHSALAAQVMAQGHGSIVFLSSVAGERVRRSNFAYGASKAGADGFYLGLGEALAEHGGHVLVVRPGFVRTKMTAGREAAPLAVGPDEVAAAVVAGVAARKELVWVPSSMRVVMSGLRHVPRALFRKLPL